MTFGNGCPSARRLPTKSSDENVAGGFKSRVTRAFGVQSPFQGRRVSTDLNTAYPFDTH